MKWLLIHRFSSVTRSKSGLIEKMTQPSIGLPTWVEQIKDRCTWSTSSIPTIGQYLFGLNHLYFFLYHSLYISQHLFIFNFTVCADYLFVTATLCCKSTDKIEDIYMWSKQCRIGLSLHRKHITCKNIAIWGKYDFLTQNTGINLIWQRTTMRIDKEYN